MIEYHYANKNNVADVIVLGCYILFHLDNVWSSSTACHLALCDYGNNGNKNKNNEIMGDHSNIFQLRFWTYTWTSNDDRRML